jgi:hypothetical protein
LDVNAARATRALQGGFSLGKNLPFLYRFLGEKNV